MNDEKNNIYSADIIETNSGRRFVSEKQIIEFANKVDKDYLNEKLNELKAEQDILIRNTLSNIINMRKVTDNLNSVKALLDSDATLDKLIILAESKIGQEELNIHSDDELKHISSEDRANLELLADIMTSGGYDWDAEPEAINAIKNKPESLPADGGNADTVANKNINTILSGKKTSTIVIGSSKYGYNKDNTDLLCNGDNDTEIIQSAIDQLKDTIGGDIYLLPGTYNITDMIKAKREENKIGSIIITGCGNATILNMNNKHLYIDNNISLERISISMGKIVIGNSNRISSCRISGGHIMLYDAVLNSITNCDIYDSEVLLTGKTMNNIITGNRMLRTTMPRLVGDNYAKYNYIIL